MDYVEAFRNLKTNQKYSRKTPHKAVLLLTVIELYETNVLTNNEIPYNDVLQNKFNIVWSRVLPGETLFHPEAYFPFWHMQSEDFWHIVPVRGKEYILEELKDRNTKPSERKIKESVKYAELDDDLYFLMTLPSGRSSLKRVLLENYTELPLRKIEKLSSPVDNSIDNSVEAIKKFTQIKSSLPNKKTTNISYDSECKERFRALTDDVQIALNLEYFTFLKRNPYDREALREICADVYQLLDRLTVNPVTLSEISPSFVSTYRDFLYDLKVAMMSENGAMDLIGSIDETMQVLDGAEPVSYESAGLNDFVDDYRVEVDFSEVPQEEFEEEAIPDTPVTNELPELKPAAESRRRKRWDEEEEFIVKYYFERGYSFDVIASAMGRSEISIKSKLNLLGLIDYDWETDSVYTPAEPSPEPELKESVEKEEESEEKEDVFNYVPKGKIAKIKDVVQNTYDLLFMIALVDLETVSNRRGNHTLDELACMMIAHAWEIMNNVPEAMQKENELRECIEFLIEESKEYMDVELSWESSKDDVFEAIKDYPMAGVFEDTVECLVYEAPYNVLRAWYPDESNYEIQANSQNFTKPCLYAIYNKKIDPFITINGGWQGNIFYDHDQLLRYFKIEYNKFLK